MELNRNHYFLLGVLLLLFGAQFRMVDSLVLTSEFSSYLAEQTGQPVAAVSSTASLLSFGASSTAVPVRKVVHPPEWLGWSLLSFGAVFVLHAMAMTKPSA